MRELDRIQSAEVAEGLFQTKLDIEKQAIKAHMLPPPFGLGKAWRK
jgi:hypothetical protein